MNAAEVKSAVFASVRRWTPRITRRVQGRERDQQEQVDEDIREEPVRAHGDHRQGSRDQVERAHGSGPLQQKDEEHGDRRDEGQGVDDAEGDDHGTRAHQRLGSTMH